MPHFLWQFSVWCLSSHIFLGQESWLGGAMIAVTQYKSGFKKPNIPDPEAKKSGHIEEAVPSCYLGSCVVKTIPSLRYSFIPYK